MEYFGAITALNKSQHFVWEFDRKTGRNTNARAVSIYVIYLKDGTTAHFSAYIPCIFDNERALEIADSVVEAKIVGYLVECGYTLQGKSEPIKKVEQKKARSFDRKNVIYETHSHTCKKIEERIVDKDSGDEFVITFCNRKFIASYNIVAKLKYQNGYQIVCTNGTDYANSKGEAIAKARRTAELELMGYNLGPEKPKKR